MLLSTETVKRRCEDHQLGKPSVCLLPHCGWRWAFLCQPADAPAAEDCGCRDGSCPGSEGDRSWSRSSEPLPGPCVTGEHVTFLSAPTDIRVIADAVGHCVYLSTGSERPGIKVQKPHWDRGGFWQAWRGRRRIIQGGLWLCWSGHNHSQASGGEPQTTCVSTNFRSGNY